MTALDVDVDVDVAPSPYPASCSPWGPGTCNADGYPLVTHRTLGLRWPFRPVATVCRSLEHSWRDRERCRWCGGELRRPGEVWTTGTSRREHCCNAHRLADWRHRHLEAAGG